MAKTRYELDSRVLTIFFFVAIPFVVLGSFLVVSMARGRLEAALGSSLEQRATETKLWIERYMGDQVVHLRMMAYDPLVRQTVVAGSAHAADPSRLEAAWASGADPAALAPVLDSPLAGHLRDVVRLRPAVRLVQAADAHGHLVASSSRAGRFANAEAPWFKAIAANLVERPFVSDVREFAGSTSPMLEIAYPILDAEDALLGGVRALLDVADLYTVLAPVRIGRTGHAVLLRSTDGLIVASDETQGGVKAVFPGFESVHTAIERERRGYWTIPEIRKDGALVEPSRVAGFSQVEQVPGVKWLVAVEQDAEEAAAPIAEVTRYLWIHFLGVFGTVILLAVYFSFKLERPVIEEELHLHEEHVPRGLNRTGTEG
jgi:hypothetical protein